MKNKEINRLIAEKVMGWVLEDNVLNFDEDTTENAYVINGETNQLKKVYKFEKDFNPSIDISHAWLVVEKLYVSVTPQCGAPYDMQCHAEIDNQPTGNYYEAFAKTAPLAICKVALRSYGIEI